MNKVRVKNVSLSDLFAEVRALRRDVSVFMPSELVDEYKNKKEIMGAYHEARRTIVRTKRA